MDGNGSGSQGSRHPTPRGAPWRSAGRARHPYVFAVPGESYLDVLDGLYDVRQKHKLVTCRFEAGAVNMAEAFGKLKGRPAAAMVTRGPGACHGAIGVHVAMQDSTPLLLFVGQIPHEDDGRDAFQEVDYRRMFGPLAKWVTQIDQAKRIPEIVAHAMDVAMSGRPGPVVVALSEEMQKDLVEVPMCRVSGSRWLTPIPRRWHSCVRCLPNRSSRSQWWVGPAGLRQVAQRSGIS